MTPDAIAYAAELLSQARQYSARFNAFPPACRPPDMDAGYAVQDALHDQLGLPVAGYKIGCTTAVMQRFLGIDQPCAGQILAQDVHESPAALAHGAFRRVGVECEIAVRLGADLPPGGAPYDRDSVGRAVESCMAAIEIVDDRYVDYKALDAPTLVADDFFGAGCVLGTPLSDWHRLDLATLEGAMAINGTDIGRGVGAHVMGHPFEALAWLANTLARRGRGLAAGDVVLTGSIVETRWLDPGDRVTVAIDGLGEAEASLT